MSKDVKAFLERIGYEEGIIPDDLATIKDQKDINYIVDGFGIYTRKDTSFVSIANILGYEYTWKGQTPDFFGSLSDYFDSEGDSYHSRSVGLLLYDSEELIRVVKESTIRDPICVREVERGKYIISSNGIHRYSALRAHYLLECSKVGFDPEKVSEIAMKYTIPVKEEKLDIEKTYSKYILQFMGAVNRVDADYDSENYVYTGKSVVTFKDGSQAVLDDQELVGMVEHYLSSDPVAIDYFSEQCSRYESFNEYACKYVPSISNGGGVKNDTETNKTK